MAEREKNRFAANTKSNFFFSKNIYTIPSVIFKDGLHTFDQREHISFAQEEGRNDSICIANNKKNLKLFLTEEKWNRIISSR